MCQTRKIPELDNFSIALAVITWMTSPCTGWDLAKTAPAIHFVSHIQYHILACCREYTTFYNASPFHSPLSIHGSKFSCACLKNISTCATFDLTSTVIFIEVKENNHCTYPKFTQQWSCPCLSLTCIAVCADLIVESHPFNRLCWLAAQFSFFLEMFSKYHYTVSVGMKTNEYSPLVCLSQLEQMYIFLISFLFVPLNIFVIICQTNSFYSVTVSVHLKLFMRENSKENSAHFVHITSPSFSVNLNLKHILLSDTRNFYSVKTYNFAPPCVSACFTFTSLCLLITEWWSE